MRNKLLLLLLLPLQAVAQNNPLAGRDTLVLVSERIEALPPSAKPSFTLPKPDFTFTAQGLQFRPDSIQYQPTTLPFVINQAPVPKPLWQKLYKHHVVGGIGAFITPVFRGYFTNGRSTDKHIVIQAEHFSSPNGHLDYASFARNEIQADGRLMKEKYNLYANLKFHHYRYNTFADTLIDTWQRDPNSIKQLELERHIKQRYLMAQMMAGIASAKADSKLAYDLPLMLRYYADRNDALEWNLSLEPTASYKLSRDLKLKGALNTTLGFLHHPSPDTNYTQQMVQLGGSLLYSKGALTLEGGGAVAYAAMPDSNSVQIYPTLRTSYRILPALEPYVDISGRMVYLNRYQLAPSMPYLRKDQAVLPYSERLLARAGLRGSYRTLSYDVAAVIRNVGGMPVFFGSDSAGVYYGRSLEPGYFLALQEKNLTALGVDAEARYSLKKHLTANLRVQYYHYSLQNLEHYYHMPGMMAEAGIRYFYKEKLLTTLMLNYTGQRTMSRYSTGTTTSQPGFADLNLHLEYVFSRRFSLFCQFNNLLNQKYYRWTGYQERPLDFRLGGTVSF